MGDDNCKDHSGHGARITNLEKSSENIFKRLRELEIAVWKAAGASGLITAILVVLIERMTK